MRFFTASDLLGLEHYASLDGKNWVEVDTNGQKPTRAHLLAIRSMLDPTPCGIYPVPNDAPNTYTTTQLIKRGVIVFRYVL